MKVAIIGCGFMGFTHAEAYKRIPNVELVGICGLKDQADSKAAAMDIPYYESLEQMIQEAKPEVISICVPTHLHREMTVRIASAGIHVICEKPMASNIEEAEEMIEVCKQNGVRLFIAHVLRFFPSYQNMKTHVDKGEIGALGVINTRRVVAHPGKDPQSWYNDDLKSGGVVLDLMIHDTDFVSSLLGEVKTVFAMKRKTETKQYALVTYKFENGTIANLEALWGYSGPLTSSCRISGKKGVIRFNSENSSSIRINRDESNEMNQQLASPLLQDPYQIQLEHFLGCIKNNKEPLITVDDAYRALYLSQLANISADIGQPIHISSSPAGGMHHAKIKNRND